MSFETIVKVAATSLNQWAMDFDGNYRRIGQSVSKAIEQGARYRFGPELEICGYGCSDHYFESDTILHCWQVLKSLMDDFASAEIVVDVGMPVTHKGCMYNCRVLFHKKKILGIVPKQNLANDGGNYREMRYFVAWRGLRSEEFYLPNFIAEFTGQKTCKIGCLLFRTKETLFGLEVCEDIWTIKSPHIDLYLQGAELVFNSSVSHFKVKKDWDRHMLVSSSSIKHGGLYGFCTSHGCDGDRLYCEGDAQFGLNGQIVALNEMFSLSEVQCLTCTVDLNDIRAARSTILSSTNTATWHQAQHQIEVIDVSYFSLCPPEPHKQTLSSVIDYKSLSIEEEISFAPAMWLWDYLRRSGMAGFFLALSGGIDSASTACIVAYMCDRLVKNIEKGDDPEVLSEVRRIVGDSQYVPKTRQDLASKLFYTCYMASEASSSVMTRDRATKLASAVGSSHRNIFIDLAVNAMIKVFETATGFIPKFRSNGGSKSENLALQNIQARIRMVFAYLFAQLSVYVATGREQSLLVLGSGNVDEALRGYLTKYDCSSADINPIGGISKTDLRKFISYTAIKLDIPVLKEIYEAPPTAELEPLKNDGEIQQTDEDDMGMTYAEISVYGVLRKVNKCGPYSMYLRLVNLWSHLTPLEVANKVKHFFTMYAINRHKLTVLTPSVHMESYSPDDNRFDLRQFLYNVRWPWQFTQIDSHVQAMQDNTQSQ